ncbi:alpha/beta hydrolase [Anaerocolumna xylanovorans]|uniref:Alpha/beta hydrolase family protein n=1 Tax=Anaerocolumna xylanovorans DSM 12503 TaxID=1121345 RepID=A0A1M7XZB6_9FIRM|nr:hypothetical protein [Anaerocolumna xylanovorans]SHO44517.1 Alpha/beta hydrolase family protein [Anaerocolumna xylanovorans DSM 12503]
MSHNFKIKSVIKFINQTVKNSFLKIIEKIKVWGNRNYKGTGKPLALFTDIITGILLALMLLNSGLPKLLGFLLAFGILFLLLNLLRIILLPIAKLAWKLSPRSIYLTVELFWVLTYLWEISLSSGGNSTYTPSQLLAIILVLALLLFIRSFYAIFRLHRKTPSLLILLILSLFITGAGTLFLVGDGFSYPYVKAYLSIQKERQASVINTDLAFGPLKTTSIEYGTKEEALTSRTANLSSYVTYEGLTKKLRDFYWGHSIDKVPIKGKVWYPAKGKNYPVMFIVHGNHSMTTDSYLGYSYLGEYLASFGYIVVSVDESFLNGYINNGLSGENDARAILLLENMREMEKDNMLKGNPLYEKMDFNNLTLAGHSRGGEAIAIAALYNTLSVLPENGNIHLNYKFNIKSLVAIAPCADQYRPSGRDVELKDINYLLVHGSNDQDVSYMMGEKQYHNITFTGKDDNFEAFLYIADANHGQFNSKWGRFDLSTPYNLMLNTKNLIPEKVQQNTLKITLKNFLDATVKKDSEARKFFTDYNAMRRELPENLYLNGYEDSSIQNICTYEEDTDLTTATMDKIKLYSLGASYWYETKLFYELNGPDRDDYALSYAWKDSLNSYYEMQFSEPYQNVRDFFQFDIMDDREYPKGEKEISPLDLTVKIMDTKGEKAYALLSDYAKVYPSLPVMTTKLQFLTDTPIYKHYFQTVRIPVEAFLANNKKLDTSSIKEISFYFDKLDTGNIKLDNIGFSN